MLGLPAHPGRYGTILIVLGLLAAAALARPVWRALRGSLGYGEAERWAAVILAASLLPVVATAPFLAWRVVEDLRYTSRLTPAQAERRGGATIALDPRLVDRLRALIPPGETFYVTASAGLPPVSRKKVSDWAGYELLPRIRVRDPARAQWIVAWNRDPRTVGPRVAAVTRVGPIGDAGTLLLGRVAA
jgi:hypothetical protein